MSAYATLFSPLNVFQRLIRSWEQVHPYNAAQVMTVRGAVDAAAAGRAWVDALVTAGFDGCVAGACASANGRAAAPVVQPLSPGTTLDAHLSDEMNRAFGVGDASPFRPFVAPAERAGETRLGVVYQHYVADSVAIRLLLREWFVRLFDADRAGSAPLRAPAAGYWHMFGPARPGWATGETALALFRRHMRYRTVRKVRTAGPRDYPVRVLLREAPAGLVDRLRAAARSRGAKVNDLFLAAAAEACHRHVPTQRRANRRDVAIGSIVDLRPYAGDDLRDTFGLFLGFTEVVCRPPDLRDFDRLVGTIATQNRRHRRAGIGPSSLGWMLAALAAARFVPSANVYHFYRKEVPLAGGVSNVNLNDCWASAYHPSPLLEYVRVSPTGPLVPLVFTLTTLGSRLHLGFTYRAALLDEAAAGQVIDAFLGRLDSIGVQAFQPSL